MTLSERTSSLEEDDLRTALRAEMNDEDPELALQIERARRAMLKSYAAREFEGRGPSTDDEWLKRMQDATGASVRAGTLEMSKRLERDMYLLDSENLRKSVVLRNIGYIDDSKET